MVYMYIYIMYANLIITYIYMHICVYFREHRICGEEQGVAVTSARAESSAADPAKQREEPLKGSERSKRHPKKGS